MLSSSIFTPRSLNIHDTPQIFAIHSRIITHRNSEGPHAQNVTLKPFDLYLCAGPNILLLCTIKHCFLDNYVNNIVLELGLNLYRPLHCVILFVYCISRITWDVKRFYFSGTRGPVQGGAAVSLGCGPLHACFSRSGYPGAGPYKSLARPSRRCSAAHTPRLMLLAGTRYRAGSRLSRARNVLQYAYRC